MSNSLRKRTEERRDRHNGKRDLPRIAQQQLDDEAWLEQQTAMDERIALLKKQEAEAERTRRQLILMNYDPDTQAPYTSRTLFLDAVEGLGVLSDEERGILVVTIALQDSGDKKKLSDDVPQIDTRERVLSLIG